MNLNSFLSLERDYTREEGVVNFYSDMPRSCKLNVAGSVELGL